MRVAGALQANGLDVRGIRPPTVPAGTARLRISITLNVDEAAIDRLDAALAEALARRSASPSPAPTPLSASAGSPPGSFGCSPGFGGAHGGNTRTNRQPAQH